ncbi:MAG TPA: aminoacyl-tRNA hydrolase [Phycisphaerales bacterium]|nr:aminoacyl-tRNA hydrolase [Phycisphaerales bacterium]HIB51302.1 aminoacyl-tRNA hydrolase [Phycisphaerales bacterium]HIN83397.1 aminoacyl-tRNA hydrolase [Phycisphaerales bacterium]HIO19794.1 aminoacyl-tRNA hydrolase [Phycisphaerales bacterium]HIO52321.1 aminoacyl-tRNA hydrolase [Phycisphaerales bacterium]
MLFVTSKLSIPSREIKYVYGTSSGPGGQHVNKVATKATLLFNVLHSESLSPVQKLRVMEKLKTRINKLGVLRVVSSKFKSQKKNREIVRDRFVAFIRESIQPVRKRKKSKVPFASKRKRLDSKKKRGETKRLRNRVHPEH